MDNFLQPKTLSEALEQRAAHPDYLPIAGCTDVMVGFAHKAKPAGVIDLFGLSEIRGVCSTDDALSVGAATTYGEMLSNELVNDHFPSLIDAIREIGAVQIQERGTLGGNLGTCSPVGDTLPVLLACDAQIHVASVGNGSRIIPIHDFIVDYRKNALAKDELIVEVKLPLPQEGTRQYWRKVGTRRAQAISKLMIALVGRMNGNVLEHVRVALGAVAASPIRVLKTEASLAGKLLDENAIALAQQTLSSEIHPIDDVRSNANYRKEVASNLLGRFLRDLGGL